MKAQRCLKCSMPSCCCARSSHRVERSAQHLHRPASPVDAGPLSVALPLERALDVGPRKAARAREPPSRSGSSRRRSPRRRPRRGQGAASSPGVGCRGHQDVARLHLRLVFGRAEQARRSLDLFRAHREAAQHLARRRPGRLREPGRAHLLAGEPVGDLDAPPGREPRPLAGHGATRIEALLDERSRERVEGEEKDGGGGVAPAARHEPPPQLQLVAPGSGRGSACQRR